MVHRGVFFVRHPVVMVVGAGPPGPQASVVVADVESQDQEQAEHAHRPRDHRRQGHGSQGRALGCGHCGGRADVQVWTKPTSEWVRGWGWVWAWQPAAARGRLFTRDLRVLVAVVCGAALGVDAGVVLDRGGADKRAISGDQLLLVNALALLGGLVASRLTEGDKTDAIGDAAGVGAAAVAVALEAWRKAGGGELAGRLHL